MGVHSFLGYGIYTSALFSGSFALLRENRLANVHTDMRAIRNVLWKMVLSMNVMPMWRAQATVGASGRDRALTLHAMVR